MTDFISSLNRGLNTTTTWNGAKAYTSTLNSCVDFFGKVGSSRDDLSGITHLFNMALNEDEETALRILFYGRDVRSNSSGNGGQGERSVFRHVFRELAISLSPLARKLVHLIPFYGRWDDILVLHDTYLWPLVIDLFKAQLDKDVLALNSDNSVSLLGKWLPSINASSKRTKELGRKVAKDLGLSEKDYRQLLVRLRTRINIVEHAMCSGDWSNINYEHVPSKAMLMYRKAFQKHDEDRYKQYIEAVSRGEKKINASTLYPYDISNAVTNSYTGLKKISNTERQGLSAQWQALPNYMEGADFNGLVLADVSGSMYSPYSYTDGTGKRKTSNIKPIDVSVSLAVYIAERNTSDYWKDKFIVFDGNPRLVSLPSSGDIYTKLQTVVRSTQRMENTNLMKAIKAILDAGVKGKVPQDQMPSSLIIVSDMQFDRSCNSNKRTNLEQMQKLYDKAGYTMPNIIFWNVCSASNVPMTIDDRGVALVSGCSPSTMKAVLNSKVITAVDVMREAVYSSRYDAVSSAIK